MDFLANIKTQFVLERIKETAWENRAYIGELYKLERLVVTKGPHGTVEAMLFKALTNKYPVEHECLRREVNEGVRISNKDYTLLCQKHLQQTIATDRAQQQGLMMWIEAGGR